MLAIGIAQTVFGQIPFFLGLHTTTAINGGLITATQPALIFLLAWIVFREPASLSQLAGLVVALIGALAVILRGDVVALLQLHFVAGDLLVQLGVLSWAMFAILVRQAPDALSPLVIFEAMTLASIVALAPCYAAEMLIWDNYTRVDLPTVITVLYLALFASILALVFLSMGIRRLGPSRSGVYNYLIPIFTALLAVLVLAETIETYHFVGLILVCAGVFLTSRSPGLVSR